MFHVYEIEAWGKFNAVCFSGLEYIFFFLSLKAVDIDWDSLKTPCVFFLELLTLCHLLDH